MSFESFFDGLIIGVTVATIFSAISDFIDKIEQHDDKIEKLSSRLEKHESSQEHELKK